MEICDNEKCRDDEKVGIDGTWDAYFSQCCSFIAL